MLDKKFKIAKDEWVKFSPITRMKIIKNITPTVILTEPSCVKRKISHFTIDKFHS